MHVRFRLFSASLLVVAVVATIAVVASPAAAGRLGSSAVPRGSVVAANRGQFLYVYNQGVPGEIGAAYARYGLPDLNLFETTAADAFGSNVAFSNGFPYFADTDPQSGYGVYKIRSTRGAVAPIEAFSGLCSYTPNLFNAYVFATGPTGAFYVLSQCSDTVSKYVNGTLVATYYGGAFGLTNAPTALVVDHRGDLYVGDSGGGVTYFREGTTTPVIALRSGCCNGIHQLVVDAKGDVWNTQAAAGITYFDAGTCTIDPVNGTDKRFEVADRFRDGRLIQRLWSAPSTAADFGSDATSIAVDSNQRVYLTAADGDYTVVTDFDPNHACPDLALTLRFPPAGYDSYAELAIDAQDDLIVASPPANTISIYPPASRQPINVITQRSTLVNLSTIAVGGP